MRPRHTRLSALVTVVMALAVVLATAPTALAAPANDTWRDATRIRVGTTVEQDTSAATAEPIDQKANENCGAPRVKASVWFKYRAGTTRRLLLDATGSGYSVGLMVFRGRPSADSLVTCGPMQVGFRARADRRYFVMAFSDSRANGGDLVLSLDTVKPPTLDVVVSDTAVLSPDGAITVSATVRCTGASFLGLETQVRQPVGRLFVMGFYFTESDTACDGTDQVVEMPVQPDNGIFAGGRALVDVLGYACGPFDCAEFTVTRYEVQVKRASSDLPSTPRLTERARP